MKLIAFEKTKTFLEMIKFEHSIFALPFAYLGLFLAERGWPRLDLFVWVTVAMVSFRTMAMGANRLIDHVIDARNPRTQNRALPRRLLSRSFVSGMTLFSFAIFIFSAYRLGPLCLKLAAIPVVLAWLYPFMKRFAWFSHLLLGMILGIAPYGAWVASRGDFSWVPGLLLAGITVWVAGFDIIYALQDLEFDRREGLHSFPSKFGFDASILVSRFAHLAAVACWWGAGYLAGLGFLYFAGLTLAALFLVREHWLLRHFGLKKLNEAFFMMNAVVSIAVFAAAAADLTLGGF